MTPHELLNEAFQNADLLDWPQMACVVDCKPSELKRWLVDDPGRVPAPLYLNGLPHWPFQQVLAWVDAGEPRDFPAEPRDFVPAAIWQFSDQYRREVSKAIT